MTLTRADHAGIWVLGFSGSRAVRSSFLVCVSQSVCGLSQLVLLSLLVKDSYIFLPRDYWIYGAIFFSQIVLNRKTFFLLFKYIKIIQKIQFYKIKWVSPPRLHRKENVLRIACWATFQILVKENVIILV